MTSAPEETALSVFILTGESRARGSRADLALYGSSSSGPVEIVIPFEPYFFVDADAFAPPADGVPDPSMPLSAADSPASLRTLSGKSVVRVSYTTPALADAARKRFRAQGFRTYEADLRARDRFLMDSFVRGWMKIRGIGVRRGNLLCFVNPAVEAVTPEDGSWVPPFVVCSLDIETSVKSGEVLSIGAHVTTGRREVQRVFMQGHSPPDSALGLTFHDSERQLLSDFLSWFHEADPDLIIGWNVIGFDLAFLATRASALKIPFGLGREGRPFSIAAGSGRMNRASVPGRVVLDGPQVLRNSFYSFESYSLENVSRQVLGEGKLIGPETNRGYEIERLFREQPRRLAEYNIRDCILVSRIFEKLGLLELTIRRTMLSGLLLDQVGYSTAAFDHFYLPLLHRHGYVAPDLEDIRATAPSGGGYVLTPTAGLYENVLSLDFRSLYPSIIRTFCIDPLSLACREEDPIQTPAGYRFSGAKHILPDFIRQLMEERANARRKGDAALSQAIKILMNSFYGVMGSPGSRLYDSRLADAITQTGQWLLLESKKWLEARGHRVLYGDTDSLFVLPGALPSPENDEGSELARTLTAHWAERLRSEFGTESQLLVEFKKRYRKFLLPAARGSSEGAKKRYAGMVIGPKGEEFEFVGLEAVRSDWTPLARDFQRDLYARVFRAEPIGVWLRELLNRIRAGEFDEKLVYRKRLHQDPKDYSGPIPPYVRAALLLDRPVRQIRYVMTTTGPVPVELAPRNPDYTHYIERQIKPVADSILEAVGTSFAEQVKPVQLSLW